MLHNGYEGRAWRVAVPIINSQDEDLVIPQQFHAGPANIGNMTHGVAAQIIMQGFAFNFEASNGVTLSILAHDDPWISEGTVVDDPVYQFVTTDAGYYQQAVTPCNIPISPTQRRRDASPTTARGATLKLTTSGDFITGGFFTAWGIYTSDISGRQASTGSPVNWTPTH